MKAKECHVIYDKRFGNIGDIVRGKPAHNRKNIKNSDNQQFYSITEAQNKTGILRTSIANCLANRAKTAGGLIWQYQ